MIAQSLKDVFVFINYFKNNCETHRDACEIECKSFFKGKQYNTFFQFKENDITLHLHFKTNETQVIRWSMILTDFNVGVHWLKDTIQKNCDENHITFKENEYSSSYVSVLE